MPTARERCRPGPGTFLGLSPVAELSASGEREPVYICRPSAGRMTEERQLRRRESCHEEHTFPRPRKAPDIGARRMPISRWGFVLRGVANLACLHRRDTGRGCDVREPGWLGATGHDYYGRRAGCGRDLHRAKWPGLCQPAGVLPDRCDFDPDLRLEHQNRGLDAILWLERKIPGDRQLQPWRAHRL